MRAGGDVDDFLGTHTSEEDATHEKSAGAAAAAGGMRTRSSVNVTARLHASSSSSHLAPAGTGAASRAGGSGGAHAHDSVASGDEGVGITTAELFEAEHFVDVSKEWESLKTLRLVFQKYASALDTRGRAQLACSRAPAHGCCWCMRLFW
ncbi:hypothetical protein EON66_11220 [archaeon]|nr:MAG: hypothetical protein EON66_11220 [archaeon]